MDYNLLSTDRKIEASSNRLSIMNGCPGTCFHQDRWTHRLLESIRKILDSHRLCERRVETKEKIREEECWQVRTSTTCLIAFPFNRWLMSYNLPTLFLFHFLLGLNFQQEAILHFLGSYFHSFLTTCG